MKNNEKAATKNATERQNIENFISKFISENYNKDFATGEKELRDGWMLRAVYYDVDGYGFTDVLLTNHDLDPTLHCGTIKAGCDIPRVAEVCADMMAVKMRK